MMRHRFRLLLCFVMFAVGSVVRSSDVVAADSADGDKAETLKVLSYNIHMWQPSVADVAAIIKAADADIVGLNEAWSETKNNQIAEALGYNILYGGHNPAKPVSRQAHSINHYYMPQVLLTRHKIIKHQYFNAMAVQKKENKPDFDPKVPIYRGGTMAVLETKLGHRVCVFVLHLHPWGDGDNEKMTNMRLNEIKAIVQQVKPHEKLPTLIIGDFNTQSHKDVKSGFKVSRFLEDQGFVDLYRAVHPDVKSHPGLTCGNSRIDYIFGNQLIKPVSSKVVTQGVFGSTGYKQSDHLGIFGVVKIGGR